MSHAVISRQTDEALNSVMTFFGIDAYNKPLFGIAAATAGVDSFSVTIEALASAIASDSRRMADQRIKARIAEEKERKR